jgi:hypothetical protein
VCWELGIPWRCQLSDLFEFQRCRNLLMAMSNENAEYLIQIHAVFQAHCPAKK